MKHKEIELILSKQNASIVAPAGHGKTEMIVDLVEAAERKVLLVTHTNAGIDALSKRLKKRNIDNSRYSITTIAGFALRWCTAYPHIANIDLSISTTDKAYYPMQYNGAQLIFKHEWARSIVKNSYGYIIVDEYQDCILEQHYIFEVINKSVPVIVFGDPLQAIFGWAGHLVSWKNMPFESVFVETFPWRWGNTNPKLGKYLSDIRTELLPGLENKKVTISISDIDDCTSILPSTVKRDMSFLRLVRGYKSVLYITKWPREQCAICQLSAGTFQNDEPQGLNELFDIAAVLDEANADKTCIKIYEFIQQCTNKVSQELGSYYNHITRGDYNFSRIKKHSEFGVLLLALHEACCINNVIMVLEWVQKSSTFRIYRIELFTELIRALRYARDNDMSIADAAQRIRTIPGLQKKYPGFKMLASRTLLSKGLEFECVVIDVESGLSVTDYYVAMTRATKMIYLISDKKRITLTAPKL